MDAKDLIIEKQAAEIKTIKETIAWLQEEIARLKKNSSNSSKPPSSDIVKPHKTLSKISRKKRTRGGQHGHKKFSRQPFEQQQVDEIIEYEFNDKDAETCFFLGSALGRSGENKEGIHFLYNAMQILTPAPNEISNIYSEMAYIYLNQDKYQLSLQYLKLAYKSDATPLLSFKMGQLYDYYLDNKKLAINYYEGYLTMANDPDTLIHKSIIIENSFTQDPKIIENAKERIKILKEELFFESAKKEQGCTDSYRDQP